MTSATLIVYRPTDVDEAAYELAISKQAAVNKRNRDKRGAKSLWAGRTDAELDQAARDYLSSYRHHFSNTVPVAFGTPS